MIKWILIFILLYTACNLEPPIKDVNEPDVCYRWEKCLYWNQKGKDKSSCQQFQSECSKRLTYEYCKKVENRIKIKVQTRTGLVEGDDFFAGCYTILK